MRELTTSAWVGHRTGPDGSADLGAVHGLTNEVRRRVGYVISATSVTTTADEAVIRGRACARTMRTYFSPPLDPAEFLHGTAATFGQAITKWLLQATRGPRRGSPTWGGWDLIPRIMCAQPRRMYASRWDRITSMPHQSEGSAGPVNEEMTATVHVDPVEAGIGVLSLPAYLRKTGGHAWSSQQ